jgi:hypothetical protein
MTRTLAFTALVVAFATSFCGEPRDVSAEDSYPYAAFVQLGTTLRIFPLNSRREVDAGLPFSVANDFAVDPNGNALYAQKIDLEKPLDPPIPGIYMIQFNPARAAILPGSEVFSLGTSIAVSPKQDKFLAFGATGLGDPIVTCGIFEFTLADRKLRKILGSDSCQKKDAWFGLSLAPDGLRGVGIRGKQLAVIDLVSGSTRMLGEGFYEAAWAPNGRWIVAGDATTKDIVLFDASTFARIKVLGDTSASSMLQFSPDSRYVLTVKGSVLCGIETYSLQMIDVESGQASIIESSRCKVVENVGGWISSSVLPQR